jgi:hypothetical protein
MVQKPPEARLDDFIIKGTAISRNGTQIATFASAVAEIARLDDRLYIILSVPDPYGDKDYAGTNLLCIGLDGHLIWRAPNLNEGVLARPWATVSYSDLRFFDKEDPKIICYVDERRSAMRQADTGGCVTSIKPVDWKQNYIKAWKEHGERIREQEESVFLESLRLCPVSETNPLVPRSSRPASVQRHLAV